MESHCKNQDKNLTYPKSLFQQKEQNHCFALYINRELNKRNVFIVTILANCEKERNSWDYFDTERQRQIIKLIDISNDGKMALVLKHLLYTQKHLCSGSQDSYRLHASLTQVSSIQRHILYISLSQVLITHILYAQSQPGAQYSCRLHEQSHTGLQYLHRLHAEPQDCNLKTGNEGKALRAYRSASVTEW